MKLTLLQFREAAQVLSLINSLGIYIHIPFCATKCTYCSFYSFKPDEALMDKYTSCIINELEKWGTEIKRPISSVYLGGGTPTVLGGKRLRSILNAVNRFFNLMPMAEITVEANPGSALEETLPFLVESGCNRISLGLQSALESELKVLGRRHSAEDAANAVNLAKKHGIRNISLDLMLGLPNSSIASLKESIDFLVGLEPQHISAYILKLEEGTALFASSDALKLPNEENCADQYLFLCDQLRNFGYEHYEISNFAKPGFKAVHNTSYWKMQEYLGLGPAAHSFLNGKRFYYPPNINEYINAPKAVFDDNGGNEQEYIMLGLRLSDGISGAEYKKLFGKELNPKIFKIAQELSSHGLATVKADNISLTDKGMLVSNSIINLFTEEI